ncbi:hypothetical protein CXG81DRAFT_20077 [Caulochytrium protostelioides]|uniref:Kri1-like C-terminal domain-containing protein n=1 Tax=Caulochytrium protostelioides TaxID=1555241 RepID=A0A4P9X4A7_9FUNG|nr:hypothetical protein CXG81DRAFT_20077 [Caulochytrium protostelioides]|eukprot:RKO99893.1 hypothetical protein CXG81DRAFT_20077 [Caulochytrium protostelioides]
MPPRDLLADERDALAVDDSGDAAYQRRRIITPRAPSQPFGSDSDSDADAKSKGFRINAEFAQKYEHRKRREELTALKDKYFAAKPFHHLDAKLNAEEETDSEDESTDEDEDEDGALVTPGVDAQLLQTIAALRTRDPKIYDPTVTFINNDEIDAARAQWDARQRQVAAAARSRVDLTTYQRQRLMAGDHLNEEDDATKPRILETETHLPTHDQEMEGLRQAFKQAASDDDGADDDDDGLLVRKGGDGDAADADATPVPKTALTADVRDPEAYRQYLLEAVPDFTKVFRVPDVATQDDGNKDGPKGKKHRQHADDEDTVQRNPMGDNKAVNQATTVESSAAASHKRSAEDDDAFLMNFILNRGWLDPKMASTEDSDDDEAGEDDHAAQRLPPPRAPKPHTPDTQGGDDEADEDAESTPNPHLRAVVPEDDDADLDAVEAADDFERSHNFRFEEAEALGISADALLAAPGRGRAAAPDSLRRVDDRRARARAAKREREQLAKQQRADELKRLKNLRRSELEAKVAELAEHAGADVLARADLDWAALLDGEFDPAAYDAAMAAAFDDTYYASGAGDDAQAARGNVARPDFDLDDPLMDTSAYEMYDEDDHEAAAGQDDPEHAHDDADDGHHEGYDDEEDGQEAQADGKKSKRKMDRKERAKLRRERKAAQAASRVKDDFIMDADYLDAVKSEAGAAELTKGASLPGALNPSDPAVKATRSKIDAAIQDRLDALEGEQVDKQQDGGRFRYREIPADDYGLSPAEILFATDKELNGLISLKKMAAYRPAAKQALDSAYWKRYRKRRLADFRAALRARLATEDPVALAYLDGRPEGIDPVEAGRLRHQHEMKRQEEKRREQRALARQHAVERQRAKDERRAARKAVAAGLDPEAAAAAAAADAVPVKEMEPGKTKRASGASGSDAKRRKVGNLSLDESRLKSYQ